MEFIGILLPPIIDLVNRYIKDNAYRFLVAVLWCVLFGIALNWIETGFVFVDRVTAYQSLSKSILAVFGASQLSYTALYSGSRLQGLIDMRVRTGARS